MPDPLLTAVAQGAPAPAATPVETNPAPAAPPGENTPAFDPASLAYGTQLPKRLQTPEVFAKLTASGTKLENLVDGFISESEKRTLLESRKAVPDKDAKPEEIDAFWKSMGKPDAPTGYQFDRSGDLEKVPSMPGLDEFTADLYHRLNLPKDVGEALWKENAKKSLELMSAIREQREAAAQEGVKELEKLWGREAPQKRQELLSVFKKSMSPKDFETFSETPLANSASFLNWMSGFKKYMSDSPIITSSGAAGPQEPKTSLDALRMALK